MKETIIVRYSCHQCGLKDVKVPVPVRGEENVLQWMEGALAPCLGSDHMSKSPHCKPRTLSEVKIPLASHDDARLGDPTEH